MRFYRFADTVRANIQSCGAWVQFGATVWGIAPGWWYIDRRNRRCFRLGLTIGAPPEFCATRTMFMLEIGRREIGYRSRGEIDPRDSRSRDVGWRFAAR